MKRFRKLGAAVLVIALLLTALPVAAANCNGSSVHTPGTTKYPANWNNVIGGYEYDYYICTVCGAATDENGTIEHQYVGPCNNGHTPGDEEYPANYTACQGGFDTPYYFCTGCNNPVDANGNLMQEKAGTGHVPGTEYPADYLSCQGGFKNAYYLCTICNEPVNVDGTPAEWYEGDGHVAGTKCEADYDSCVGGFKTEYYLCTICNNPVDVNGEPVEWFEGTGHVAGTKCEANYTACQGGFKDAYYLCVNCNVPVDENGEPVQWYEGIGVHTPGNEKHEADYRACDGGIESDFYLCTVCEAPVDADGNELQYKEGTGHVLGEKCLADYTVCGGGFKTDYYLCTICNNPVDENGEPVEWFEGTGVHSNLVKVPGQEPTYEEDGWETYWYCEACEALFFDENGNEPIGDAADIILPKLDKEEDTGDKRVLISGGLQEVPEGVAGQYDSVKAIENKLAYAALSANTQFQEDDVKHVLYDVKAQIKDNDGEWVDIANEDFPSEGVEVLLAYPDGTNGEDFEFVVTHMVTAGSNAGEVEILPHTLEPGGIRVTFTSMSPVMITYQRITESDEIVDTDDEDVKTETDTTDKTDASAETEDLVDMTTTTTTTTSNTTKSATKVSAPETGDESNVMLWLALMLCGTVVIGLTAKRKFQ